MRVYYDRDADVNLIKAKKVAVIGLGGLGHMAVKLAHAMGAEVSVLSQSLKKKEDGERLGADAPRGLDERIYHVWKLDGVEMDRIALDIHGGRKAGYRAWTHKRNFPADPVGDWRVQVVTEAGQQIGVLRFRVDPARQAGGGSPREVDASRPAEEKQD